MKEREARAPDVETAQSRDAAPVNQPTPAKRAPPEVVERHSFVAIPGGPLRFGCATGETDKCDAPRDVTVKPFELDKYEVTAGQYLECVAAGACTTHAGQGAGCSIVDKTLDVAANCIWGPEAEAYCNWIGARLPTPEEWEFAAKSGRDQQFPWGNEPLTLDRANYRPNDQPKWDVVVKAPGRYPKGANVWGIMDLAGNVDEWTSDVTASEVHPKYGHSRQQRGGSACTIEYTLKASAIVRMWERNQKGCDGFRCAR